MNLKEFTASLQMQFIDGEKLNLTPETNFRDNGLFDSLTGMAILVMIEDHFKYKMSVPDFLKCKTPADLYDFIQKAKK
jgi:acyl carrier protein